MIKLEIKLISKNETKLVAPLVALFRVELKKLKGINALPDNNAGLIEIEEYLDTGFPCFVAIEQDDYIGYIVCRVDEPIVWVESIFVKENYRGKGVATALFNIAEELAKSYDETTVYNYVHPNNERMISFLRKHGYSVLNLIEIRKPFSNEKFSQKIKVGNNEFDY